MVYFGVIVLNWRSSIWLCSPVDAFGLGLLRDLLPIWAARNSAVHDKALLVQVLGMARRVDRLFVLPRRISRVCLHMAPRTRSGSSITRSRAITASDTGSRYFATLIMLTGAFSGRPVQDPNDTPPCCSAASDRRLSGLTSEAVTGTDVTDAPQKGPMRCCRDRKVTLWS